MSLLNLLLTNVTSLTGKTLGGQPFVNWDTTETTAEGSTEAASFSAVAELDAPIVTFCVAQVPSDKPKGMIFDGIDEDSYWRLSADKKRWRLEQIIGGVASEKDSGSLPANSKVTQLMVIRSIESNTVQVFANGALGKIVPSPFLPNQVFAGLYSPAKDGPKNFKYISGTTYAE